VALLPAGMDAAAGLVVASSTWVRVAGAEARIVVLHAGSSPTSENAAAAAPELAGH
jgi:hypothetical protein